MLDNRLRCASAHERIGGIRCRLPNDPGQFVSRANRDRPDEVTVRGAEDDTTQLRFEPLKQLSRVANREPRFNGDVSQGETIFPNTAGRLACRIGTVEHQPFQVDPRPVDAVYN